MISEKCYRALKIIENHPRINASGFANRYWPDSPGHKTVKNGGHGAQRGKGMWLAAGSYLAKLHKKGYLYRGKTGWEHVISEKGREVMKEFIEHRNKKLKSESQRIDRNTSKES